MNYRSPFADDSLPGPDRRTDITARELYEEYVRPCRPVILTNAFKGRPALGRWTPEFFRTMYGDVEKEVNGVKYTLARQMDLIELSTDEMPAPYSYNLNIEHHFPELMADVLPHIPFGRTDRLQHPIVPKMLTRGTIKHEVFFGGKGCCFPVLHVDIQSLHTQVTQVYGDKEFYLYPPDQSPYMYPRTDNPRLSSVNSIFHPDLERFPLFAQAKVQRAVLRQGETLFFPTGWWHTTYIPGPSISYGRAVLNHTNWDAYLGETYQGWRRSRPLLAIPAVLLGKVLGGVFTGMEAVSRGPR